MVMEEKLLQQLVNSLKAAFGENAKKLDPWLDTRVKQVQPKN